MMRNDKEKTENEKRNNIENIDADEIIIWNMEE